MYYLSMKHATKHKMSEFLLPLLLIYAGWPCGARGERGGECVSGASACASVVGRRGALVSPGYPLRYPDHACCSWGFDLRPNELLVVRVYDLDIEEDPPEACGGLSPCCRHSWLSLPQRSSHSARQQDAGSEDVGGEGGGARRECGRGRRRILLTAPPPRAVLKFYTSKVQAPGRGFNLTYSIERRGVVCVGWGEQPCGGGGGGCFNASQRCDGVRQCASGADEHGCTGRTRSRPHALHDPGAGADAGADGGADADDAVQGEGEGLEAEGSAWCLAAGALRCRSGGSCFPRRALCDGRPHCHDFSDEVNCGYCPSGEALCGPEGGRCFDPRRQRCDGRLDCPCGQDELNCEASCPGRISCGAAGGCFSPEALRGADGRPCPSLSPTAAASDAAALPHARFRCDNGVCVAPERRCDGADHCEDASDERHCDKNSVIAAALVGCLSCALLLVVAAGCFCRAYGLRLFSPVAAPAASDTTAPAMRSPLHPPLGPPPLSHHLYAEALLLAREPPPAYSQVVAEAESQPLARLPPPPLPLPPPPPSGSRSRSRRHAPSRRALRQRPPPHAVPALTQSVVAPSPAVATRETSLADDRRKGSLSAAVAVTSPPYRGSSSSTNSSLLSVDLSPNATATTTTAVDDCDDDAPLLDA